MRLHAQPQEKARPDEIAELTLTPQCTLTPNPSPRGRGDVRLPLPLGEGWGEGVRSARTRHASPSVVQSGVVLCDQATWLFTRMCVEQPAMNSAGDHAADAPAKLAAKPPRGADGCHAGREDEQPR